METSPFLFVHYSLFFLKKGDFLRCWFDIFRPSKVKQIQKGEIFMAIKYKWLCGQLREWILSSSRKGLNKLPSEQELCRRYQVSRQTVRLALSILEQEGLIEKRREAVLISQVFPEILTATLSPSSSPMIPNIFIRPFLTISIPLWSRKDFPPKSMSQKMKPSGSASFWKNF